VCKSEISLSELYKPGVTRAICTSAGPRSRVVIAPETRYKDSTEMISWIVFGDDRTTAMGRCYCLR
jgi:hypothetical protein